MACMTVTQPNTKKETTTNIKSSEENNKASAALALSALFTGASSKSKSSMVTGDSKMNCETTPVKLTADISTITDALNTKSPPFNPLTSSASKDLFEAKTKFSADLRDDVKQDMSNGQNNGNERKRSQDMISDSTEHSATQKDIEKSLEDSGGRTENAVVLENVNSQEKCTLPQALMDSSHTPHYPSQPDSHHRGANLEPKYAPPPPHNQPYHVTYHPHPAHGHHPYYPPVPISVAPCYAHHPGYPCCPYHPHANPYPPSTHPHPSCSHPSYPPPPPHSGYYPPSYYNYPKTAPPGPEHPHVYQNQQPSLTQEHEKPSGKEKSAETTRLLTDSASTHARNKEIENNAIVAHSASNVSNFSGTEIKNGDIKEHFDHSIKTSAIATNNENKNITEKSSLMDSHGHAPPNTGMSPYPPAGSPSHYYQPPSNSMYPPPPQDPYYHPSHPSHHHPYPSSSMMISPHSPQYHHPYPHSPYHPPPHHPSSPYPPPYTAVTTKNLPGRSPSGGNSMAMPMNSPVSSFIVSPGSPPPTKKTRYSRKDKSLGLLCSNFMARYGKENGEHGICKLPSDVKFACLIHGPNAIRSSSPAMALSNKGISIDEAASALFVERRRIYDIINILESINIVSRKCKNTYYWHGTCNLPLIFANMQLQAARMWPEDAKKHGILTSEDANSHISKDENGSEHSLINVTSHQKEKSLGKLSQEFLQLFLVGYKVISLAEATEKILGDACKNGNGKGTQEEAEKAVSWIKTKGRRLYDIANVMASIGIIKICSNEGGTGNQKNKRSFEWKYDIKPEDFFKILQDERK